MVVVQYFWDLFVMRNARKIRAKRHERKRRDFFIRDIIEHEMRRRMDNFTKTKTKTLKHAIRHGAALPRKSALNSGDGSRHGPLRKRE